jgi:AcrR family transcriptional regulator
MTAASKLFAKSGLSEVTVAQILDQSGVKAPTLYHHFGGKEGLYVTWACHTLDVMDAEFKALASTGPTLRDFLLEAGRILLSQRSMDIMQVMRDRRWLADPDSVEQIDDALKVAVFQPIARAIEDGTTIKDAGDASQLFVHTVSVRRPCYRRAGSIDPAATEEIVDLFLSGVHGGSRAVVQTGFERAREPGAPIEVK